MSEYNLEFIRKIPLVYPAYRFGRIFLQKDLSLADKYNYLGFYCSAYEVKNLFVSLPRSGSHYLMLTLNIAYDLYCGGDGGYVYEDETWKPRYQLMYPFDWRTPKLYKELILNSREPIILKSASRARSEVGRMAVLPDWGVESLRPLATPLMIRMDYTQNFNDILKTQWRQEWR